MSSPSKVTKVNYLYIRYLRFRSVRGDFLEGHSYASRCLFPLFPVPIPGFPSTKSGFLCFLGSGTPVFWLFEHKIEVFVRFWGLEPSFSGFSSTKSGFLCSRGGECGIVKRNREDAYHFATAPTPSHKSTSRTRTVLGRLGAILAPSSAVWCRVMPAGCRNGVVTVPSRCRYGRALD